MSAQDLMTGFGAYTDVEELAAEATVAREEASPVTVTITIGVSLSLTAEHTC